ncbi:hypothetical protein EPN81_04495 [Patescibacteria group bacterium]|nr:MAG: hypothetical protein EPN81_04495 [Patescibacteria group bacterium]
MRNILIVNTAIFVSVAALHALRVAYQAPVVIGSFTLPLWLSAVAVVGVAILAYLNWRALEHYGKESWLRLLLALIVIDIAVLLCSWATKLTYWGMSGDTFLWFVIIDVILVGIVLGALRKRASS